MAIASMIADLQGKTVKISDMIVGRIYKGTIIEVDDKWIKLDVKKPKDTKSSIKIICIDSIGTFDIIDD